MHFISDYKLWILALHIIAFVSWMAGLLYLPRLYVYHCQVSQESQAANILMTMERRLYQFIMTPAMIATYVFGILLFIIGEYLKSGEIWVYIKIFLVFLLTFFHFMCARWRKELFSGKNHHSSGFFRLMNEVPTILLIFIVFLAVLKPF